MKVILYTALALMLLGCGTRKSNVDLFKQSEKTNEGSKEKSEETNKTEATKETSEVNKKDKSELVVTTTVFEKLDSSGRVKERTSTTKSETRKDNSQTNKKSSESLKTFTYKTFTKTYWKEVTIRIKEKHKQTESSNLYWILALAFLGGLVVLFGFLYVKARRAITHRESMF
jgi:cobalamin biosynthesis protein CobT